MNLMQRMMTIMPGSISCKELDEKLDDYMEGDLSGWDWIRFQMHFVICKACKAYAAGYAKTVRLIKGSFDDADTPDADVSEELINNILAKGSEEPGS